MDFTFDLVKAPAKITGVRYRAQKGQVDGNGSALVVKVVRFTIDVRDPGHLASLDAYFPGIRGQVQETTEHGAPGCVLGFKRKVGSVHLLATMCDGAPLFSHPLAVGGRPQLLIGTKGETVDLVMDIDLQVSREALKLLDEVFLSDIVVSIGSNQSDLEDLTNRKRKKKLAEDDEDDEE